MKDAEAARRLREADDLYDRFGTPLEAEHYGEYVAITEDGRTLVGPSPQEVMRQAVRAFGAGSYVFKLGERVVGRLR